MTRTACTIVSGWNEWHVPRTGSPSMSAVSNASRSIARPKLMSHARRRMLAEARTRRDEIREAERELRKRLQGVETVFRSLEEGSVIPDTPDE